LPVGSRRSRCMTKWPCARRMARRNCFRGGSAQVRRTLTQTQGSETSMQLHRRTVLKGMLGSVSALALKAPAIAQSAPFKIGLLAAFELLAITDYVRDNQTPLISLAAAEDVTQRKANPFVIRPSATSAQCCHAMGDYAAKELKYKRAATISEDFAFGYEQMS